MSGINAHQDCKVKKYMNINNFKGKRFALFVIMFTIAGLQAIQPMLPEEYLNVAVTVLSFLGILKTFFPYEETKNGEIDLGK